MVLLLNAVLLLGASALVRSEVKALIGADGGVVLEAGPCPAGEYCNGKVLKSAVCVKLVAHYVGVTHGAQSTTDNRECEATAFKPEDFKQTPTKSQCPEPCIFRESVAEDECDGVCTPCETNPDGTADLLPLGAAPCGACALRAGAVDCTACDQGGEELVALIPEGNRGREALTPGADLGKMRCWVRPLQRLGIHGLPALCDEAPSSAKDETHPIVALSLGQLWGVFNEETKAYDDVPVRLRLSQHRADWMSGQRAGRVGRNGELQQESEETLRLFVALFPLNGIRGEQAAQVAGAGFGARQLQFKITTGTSILGSSHERFAALPHEAALLRHSSNAGQDFAGDTPWSIPDSHSSNAGQDFAGRGSYEANLVDTPWSIPDTRDAAGAPELAPLTPKPKMQVRILAGAHRGRTGAVTRGPLIDAKGTAADRWEVRLHQDAEAKVDAGFWAEVASKLGSPPQNPALVAVEAADLGPVRDTLFAIDGARSTDDRRSPFEADLQWTDGVFDLTADEGPLAGPKLRLSQPALKDLATCLDSIQAEAAKAAGTPADRAGFKEAEAALRAFAKA